MKPAAPSVAPPATRAPRILAGAWRGRQLRAPAGTRTRPTAARARQALFDMLLHAPWGGRAWLEGADILDAFAGTGALALEALSRGAARAWCLERDAGALAALRANAAACGAGERCTILAGDALRPPPGRACGLVLLDPPYGQGLVPAALVALRAAGWIAPGALVAAELGRDDPLPGPPSGLPAGPSPLADRAHGAARLVVWREPAGPSPDMREG